MKSAVITGASRGIGLEISKVLIELEYKVFGLARNFENLEFKHPNFIPVVCDVSKSSAVEDAVNKIKSMTNEVFVLVNNAGIGYFGPHEQLSPVQISTMVDTNLKAPLIMTSLFMKDLKKTKGFIFNISSVTAHKISTHGCAYAATKAGISHFAKSLFEEVRKCGVKVVTIHPDMTATSFFDNSDFTYSQNEGAYIKPKSVADTVRYVMEQPEGTTMTEVTIRPQVNQIRRK